MPASPHPQAPGAKARKSTTAGPLEGEKSVWKRKRSQTQIDAKQWEKQTGAKKSQAPTTKEFVIYSCNICGFTKKSLKHSWTTQDKRSPDAIVLTETNLSFTYTPDYV